MIGALDASAGKARWVCGRQRKAPMLPRYTRNDGYPENPRVWRPGRLWDRLVGRRAVWTCREVRDHSVLTLWPGRVIYREFTVQMIDDKGKPFSARERVLLKLGKHPAVTLTTELRPIPVLPVELGHRFSFNRYEAL